MPKLNIDYSNTIIYKIFCKDPNVKDLYVGHTTNFVQRKHAHKQNCMNSKSPCYNIKLYKIIRDNSGWDNWVMEIVNFFNCNDSYEARKKEQEYFLLLNATLNSIEPLPSPKINPNSDAIKDKKHNMDINLNIQPENPKNPPSYECKYCDYVTCNRKDYINHFITIKHNYNKYNKDNKDMKTYVCKNCDYTTCSKKDFNKHILTRKHIYNQDNKITTKKIPDQNMVCACGKSYGYRASLFNHKKKCPMVIGEKASDVTKNGKTNLKVVENTIISESVIIGDKINITTEMFMKLMNENQEMIKIIKDQQNQINEIIPKIGNITTNNMTTNMMNNNFNLNLFLNEKCKDALNMSEFIESLKITLEDLQYSRSNGLVQGISNVMIRGLKELDIYKRPIHCTDVKRDTMYIKDKEKWEKDETHEKIRNTIIKIAYKERNAINIWVEQNPDWFDTEETQIEYLTLVNKICEPIENDIKNEKKIIKLISKEIVLNKDTEKMSLKNQ